MPTAYVRTRYVENDSDGNPVARERGDKVEVGAAELETLLAWGILQEDPVTDEQSSAPTQ